MARYHRLSLMEREEFSRLLAVGVSLRAAGAGVEAGAEYLVA